MYKYLEDPFWKSLSVEAYVGDFLLLLRTLKRIQLESQYSRVDKEKSGK